MSNLTQQPQPPQTVLDQIIGLYNQGQLEQTVSLSESLAKQYPNALILYDILGAAYMGLKNAEKTIASYQKALQLNPNHTDAYNNMGMALYDQGKFDEAVESYKKAINLEPNFADAHYNLGNALQKKGDFKQAFESYEVSITVNPNDAEVLLNYGNALKSYGDFDHAIKIYTKALKVNPNSAAAQTNMDNADEEKAEIDKNVADYARIAKLEIGSAEIVSFTGTLLKAKGYLDAAIDNYKQAIKFKPDYAEAYLNMGNALKGKGEVDAAIDSYKKAIKVKPDYAEAYSNIGLALKDKGDLDAAIGSYKQAIKIKPKDALTCYALGMMQHEKGDISAAIDSYKKAIKIKPDYLEVYLNLGNVLQVRGELDRAIENYKKAIKINPDYVEPYYGMANALKLVKFAEPVADLPETIVKLLDKKTYVSPAAIAPAAISLIKLDKVFQSVLGRYLLGNLDQTLKQTVSELSRITLLLKIMELCPITDLEVEWLLTYLRSAILNNVFQLSDSKETLVFQAALALQCFTNEYIYIQTNEDKKNLDELEKIVQKNLADGKQPAPLALACLASFKTLHDYSWCHLLTIPNGLKNLGKRQIADVKKEIVLRSEIPTLTEIMDDISLKVREQYEANPYPRWVNRGLPFEASSISTMVKNINLRLSETAIYGCDAPEILIGGCGTGQHSIAVAARFKDCNVLAIDLSLNSLAYAQRNTEELGLKNIEYMQADILDLGKLDRQFDIVESAGVLHHMHDPMAGWRALTGCLKLGGLMRIGLYSDLARQHIVKMREEISCLNLATNDFTMKTFRQEIINSDQKHHKQLLSTNDFYSLSELRDLLFHVQEYRFTIPQIKNCLSELGLKFCGYESQAIVERFKTLNLDSNDLYDLDKWHTFEQQNPNSFISMYQFWCQKVT